MLSYALRRIAGTVPTLLVIISVSFCVVRLAPGGPFAQEQALPPPVRANLERLYGLDEPLTVQYAHYLRGLLRGDFGPSLRQRDSTVSELIAQALPLSATLGLAAILLAVLTGVPAGVLAALWRNRAADYCITTLAAVALALPSLRGAAAACVVARWLVVETVIGLPVTGRYLVEDAIERNYPLVMGMVVVYGALTLLLNLIADLIYGALNPGVRRE